MTKWIDKATLAMGPPRCVVVLDAINGTRRTTGDGLVDERVWIVEEHFDSNRGVTKRSGARKSLVGRFVEKEGGSFD